MNHRTLPSMMPRIFLRGLVLLGFAAVMAGCGGGGSASSAVSTSISGTAASGAPLANITVTLKDGTNKTATATTSATGVFSVDTTGMSPPFMLQVTAPGGTRLYSVSADASSTGTINVTPLTDLILRSWYAVQGVSTDTAFSNPASAAPPTPQQVRTIAQVVLSILRLAIVNQGIPVSAPEDLISKPFVADHTGLDKLLDNSRFTVGAGGISVVLTGGGSTQTTVVTYNTGTTTISADTITTNGTDTTTSSLSSVVPVQPAQATALDGINATLASFANSINTKKASLMVNDVINLFDPNLLHQGLNRTQFLTSLVHQFQQGQSVSFAVEEIKQLDAANGVAEVVFRLTQTLGSMTDTERVTLFFRKLNGTWVASGDGRIAKVGVQAEGRRNQGIFVTGNGPSINIDVRPVQGTVSSVSVSSSIGSPTVMPGATAVDDSGVLFDTFFANTGPLSPPLPAAGTLFTVTLNESGGGSVSYTVPLNAFTTELIQITGPTGITLASANLGGTLNVTWTLPTTYAVARVRLSALTFTGPPNDTASLQCETDAGVLGTTSTSGSLNIPATCSGRAVKNVSINLSTDGTNGERSQVIYQMQ